MSDGVAVLGAAVVGAAVVGAAVVGAAVVGAAVVGAAVVGAAVVGAAVVGAAVVGAAVVGVADGVAVAAALVADALGDAVTDFKGWQDSLLPVKVAAAALPVITATATPPEPAVSRALPAIKVTALRRPCAIRILTQCLPLSP